MSSNRFQPTYPRSFWETLQLRRLGIRVGIPLLLIGWVTLAAFLLGKEEYLYAAALAGLPFFLIAIEFALRHNHLYPIIILVSALFIPLSFNTGRSSRLVLSLVMTIGLVFLWFFQMLMEHRFRLRPTPVNAPAILFSISTVFSLLWGIAFRDPRVFAWGSFSLTQVASTFVIVMSLGVVLLTGNLITKKNLMQWMVGLFLVGGVVGLAANFTKVKLPVNTGGLFAMWCVALALALAFFNEKLSLWVRGLLIVLAGLWLYWGYGVNISWLAGWVPLIAVFLLVGFFRSPKLAVVMAILIIVMVALSWDYFSTSIAIEDKVSGTTRLAAWLQNWKITKDHLLFGTGPAGYAVYYMTYFPNQAMATHNNFLDMLSQTGIVGLVLLLWYFGAILWMGWRLLRRLRGRRDFMEALAAACLAGTLGGIMMMFFGDWLFPFAYTQSIAGFDYAVYNWLFMGLILSLDGITAALPAEANP